MVFDLLCWLSCWLAGIKTSENPRRLFDSRSAFVIEVKVGISSCAEFHHSTSILFVLFRGLYGKIKTDVAPLRSEVLVERAAEAPDERFNDSEPASRTDISFVRTVIGDPAPGGRLRRQQFHADATAGVAEGVTFRVGNQFRHNQPQPLAALGIHRHEPKLDALAVKLGTADRLA
jgi:hypothetical protein